ncbi:hypothetical protein [Candidatus Lokiarchaeum ossiferum]|uniref:hypothetical protein n=1 Tax=Candidatus Lokiarchaeum ossiferum TaxID=2951803 RepID=UPI00352FC3B8
MKKISSILQDIKKSTLFDVNHDAKEYYNEFDLRIPVKTHWMKKLFPDRMLWLFTLAIVIKVGFFFYGMFFYEEGLNRTITSIFAKWGDFWWTTEGLCDFNGDYIMFRKNWLNGEALYTDAFNGRYLYPPLFYYIIHIFARWTIYSAPIVMLICNITTGFLIFHLAKSFGATGKAAKVMMGLTLLSPINLFYSDFIWQNTGVYTTFLVLSMLMISKEKYKWGMFWLGIAISIKHVAAFYMPIFLFGIIYKLYYKPKEKWMHKWTIVQYIKSIPWSELLYYAAIPCLVFIICSSPYIFTVPDKFFGALLGSYSTPNAEWLSLIFSHIEPVYNGDILVGYFPDLTLGEGNDPYQVNFRAVLDVAFAWIGNRLGIPTAFTSLFAILFHFQFFLMISIAIIFLLYWRLIKNQRYQTDQEFYWMMWYVGSLCGFAAIMFVKIGIYKYYFVSLTPTWAIFGGFSGFNHQKWKRSTKYSIKELIRDPRKLRFQVFGGGSIFHIIETISMQLFLIYFNKWLAPAILYLPLFLIACLNFYLKTRSSLSEKTIHSVEQILSLNKKEAQITQSILEKKKISMEDQRVKNSINQIALSLKK